MLRAVALSSRGRLGPLSLVRSLVQRAKSAALDLPQLRLICDRGTSLGVMPPEEALSIAKERKLELVQVSPSADPPVWKLFAAGASVGKSQDAAAQQQQQQRPQKQQQQQQRDKKKSAESNHGREKKAKLPKVKEVRLTDRCDARDTETKAANALKFLGKGHEVKIVALNTGRIDADRRVAMAQVLVEQICEACAEHATTSGVMGRTSTEGATGGSKQILGIVSATLTPKGGASRGAPTPRSERSHRQQDASSPSSRSGRRQSKT
jgi:translation initiation factor IF-3